VEGSRMGRVWRSGASFAWRLQSWQHVPWLLPVIVLLLAVAVRFHHLETQSLWNDEGNSLRPAQRSVGDLIDAAGRDIHPPGYYLVLKAWIAAAGESEFGLRALSALQGVLTVALAIALGRALFSRAAGNWAGLFVALSPFAVTYSQETRMYAQLALLSAASLWVFVRWLVAAAYREKAAWRWALALALINAAGLYTQYTFPFTLIAQGVLFALWLVGMVRAGPRSPALRRVVTGYAALNALALVLFLPWLPTAWEQVTTWPRAGVGLALDEQVRTVLTWITYGNTAGDVIWLRFLWPGVLVAAAIWPGGERWGLPVIWLAVVVMALLGSGAYREANLKFLLPAQIALALLLGEGVCRLWQAAANGQAQARAALGLFTRQETWAILRMLAAVCAFLVAIGQAQALDALYNDPAYARDDYRAMAAAITADPRPGDAIILDAPNQVEVFTYYYDGDAPVYELPRGLGGDDAQTRADVQAVMRQHRHIFVLFWGEEERDPNRVVQATLDAEAYPVASAWYGDVRLAQYAVLDAAPDAPAVRTDARFGDSIRLTGYALSAERVRPGDVVGVTLFWVADAPLAARYKVTVQLLAPDGTLATQHDAEPANNRAPTTTWTPGETVIDTHGLVVPPGALPGEYALVVGFYPIDAPLDRLPVAVDGEPVGDVLPLPPLTVQ